MGYLAVSLISVGFALLSPGVLKFLFAWVSLSLFVLALAFATGWATLLGKRQNGSLHPLSVLVFLPYYLFVWLFFHFKCLVIRRDEPAYHEVQPGLFVGRRPLRNELPHDIA